MLAGKNRGVAHYLGRRNLKCTNRRMAQRVPIGGHIFTGLASAGSKGGVYTAVSTGKQTLSGEIMDDGSDVDRPANSWVHMGLTLCHMGVAVAAIVISVIALVLALGGGCDTEDCKTSGYLTTTFFSADRIGSQAGWAVATQRAQLGDRIQYPADKDAFVFSHYYECMASARMADELCPATEPLDGYIACLNNYTKPALTTCNSFSSSVSQPWPTPEEYLQCLFGFKAMHNSVSVRGSRNVFRNCLSKTMWPFFEVQQDIDSPLFLGSFNWLVLLATGFWILTSFSVFSVSPVETGRVDHGEPEFYKRLGSMWSFISFCWNFAFLLLLMFFIFRDNFVFEKERVVPMTNSTNVVCLFLFAASIFYFGAEFSETRDLTYFAHVRNVVVERFGRKEKVKHGHIVRERRPYHRVYDKSEETSGTGMKPMLGSILQNTGVETYDVTHEDVAKYYTPPLLNIWADALTFADPCIFLGMAGATGHLTTDRAWNLFFVMQFYRLMGSSIARYLYQCFMNNLSLSENTNQAYHAIVSHPGKMLKDTYHVVKTKVNDRKKRNKDLEQTPGGGAMVPSHGHGHGRVAESDPNYATEAHISIQVMALSTQISAILLAVVLLVLVFDSNSLISEFSLFNAFFWICFIVPEALRIIAHVVLQVWHPDPSGVPWLMLNFYFFVWIWDVVGRIIFVSYVLFGPGTTPGTRHFLMDQSIALMDTYLTTLNVF